jgi:hypothetical protein
MGEIFPDWSIFLAIHYLPRFQRFASEGMEPGRVCKPRRLGTQLFLLLQRADVRYERMNLVLAE